MSFLTKKIKIKWWLMILIYFLFTGLIIFIETLMVK